MPWVKSPLMLPSCIAASSGSIRTRTLCWPERTGITCDRLPCAEAVGINPNLFLMEPETLPDFAPVQVESIVGIVVAFFVFRRATRRN